MPRRTLSILAVLALAPATVAVAKTSHKGWPKIDGKLEINKSDADRTVTGTKGKHNELLGGHGDDVLIAGNIGDVLWGDYKPSGQPESQSDVIKGGAGKDFIYASHGKNVITSGGGADQIHVHFGHGSVTCANKKPTIFISRTAVRQKRYKLKGCTKISYKTEGR